VVVQSFSSTLTCAANAEAQAIRPSPQAAQAAISNRRLLRELTPFLFPRSKTSFQPDRDGRVAGAAREPRTA
jgi:hypothetical protein